MRRCPDCMSSEVVELVEGLSICRACGGYVPFAAPTLPGNPGNGTGRGGRMSDEMIEISNARMAIERARDVLGVMKINNLAKAAAVFYAAQGMEDNAQIAREVSLRAQRRAGEFLSVMPKATGGQPYQNISTGSTMEPVENTPTLADLDIDKHESHRWQVLANIPEEVFEDYIDGKIASGYELTSGGLMKIAKNLQEQTERGTRRQEEAGKLAQETERYPVILADPAWEYDFSRSDNRRIENHYLPSSLEEMKQLAPPATKDAILFMWATSPKLREALELMDAWDFEYKTCMIWVKDKIGMGYYARQKHELLLIGAKGDGLELPDPDIRPESVFFAPRAGHSEKPHEVYAFIESMYPVYGKYEMFARNNREGWKAWGDES